MLLPSINNIREWKTGKKWEKPGSIHHMNDVRWMQGGRRGGEVQLPKQRTGSSVRVLYCSYGLDPDLSVIETTRLDR